MTCLFSLSILIIYLFKNLFSQFSILKSFKVCHRSLFLLFFQKFLLSVFYCSERRIRVMANNMKTYRNTDYSSPEFSEKNLSLHQKCSTGTIDLPYLKASVNANLVVHKLNDLYDKMKPTSSSKFLIKISVGDPTLDGNLLPPETLKEDLIEIIKSDKFNGYPPVLGYEETRQAVATYCRGFCQTTKRKDAIDWNNIVITSGVSHGIELSVAAILNSDDSVLICQAFFPHYQTVWERYRVEPLYFRLDPDNNWECDLAHAATLLKDNTKLMIIINPSNPCGSNYSREHLQDILNFCEKHKLGLISDEIYSEMVFAGEEFTSVADFDTSVPRLVLGGASKWYACPGWRIGWTVLIDPAGVAREWHFGIDRLAQLICGANSICQVAVGRELLRSSHERKEVICRVLRNGLKIFERLLEHDIGISFARPCASMFVMLRIDFTIFKDISSDMEFYDKLLDEENVQVIPGEICGIPGFVRATISRSTDLLNEAVDRIIIFCQRHRKY